MNPNESINSLNNKQHFPEHAEWIGDHLSKFFQEEEMKVFHEMLSPNLPIHIYYIQPEETEFNILLTEGMSSYAMNVDPRVEDLETAKFAELFMLLPKEMGFDNVLTGKNPNDWIIAMLKQTARFPHEYDTWLQVGHTLQAGQNMEPYDESSAYIGAAILTSVTFEENFTIIEKEGRQINFFTLFPLYKEELEHKIEYGFNGLIDLLQKDNPSEIFDLNRKNMVL